MMGNFGGWGFSNGWSFGGIGGGWLAIVLIWNFVWKGLALWKSARNDQRYWFVALLVINTMGLLEILYLFVFAKSKLVLIREAKVISKPRSRSKK